MQCVEHCITYHAWVNTSDSHYESDMIIYDMLPVLGTFDGDITGHHKVECTRHQLADQEMLHGLPRAIVTSFQVVVINRKVSEMSFPRGGEISA